MTNHASVILDSPTSVEKLRATVYSTADPTGGAVEWQLTAIGAVPATGAAWKAGTWGTWDAADQTATTVSPPVVATLGATAGSRYRVWVRWTAAGETPERIAGELVVGG